jgi:hypothetical protein
LNNLQHELEEVRELLWKSIRITEKNSGFFIINSDENSAFFKSELVAISFLSILHELSKDKSDQNMNKITQIIKSKIIVAFEHLKKDQLGLFEGAAGYLYVLLKLKKLLPDI